MVPGFEPAGVLPGIRLASEALRPWGIGAQDDAEEPLPPAYFQAPADWSTDGRFIAFTSTGFAQIENERQGDVWLVDMARQRKMVPLLNTPFHEANPPSLPMGAGWPLRPTNQGGQSFTFRLSRVAIPQG